MIGRRVLGGRLGPFPSAGFGGPENSLDDRDILYRILDRYRDVDPESYWIYTNTPIDNDRLATLSRDGDLRHAVELLAAGR